MSQRIESCVEQLFAKVSMPSGPLQNMFTSAFTTLAQVCQYIETTSDAHPDILPIRLGLYARIRMDLEGSSDDKIFTVWGPEMPDNNQPCLEQQKPLVDTDDTKLSPTIAPSPHNAISKTLPGTPDSKLKEQSIAPSGETNLASLASLASSRPPQLLSETDGEFSIPITAVARCMSFFLDGNGRTRHPNSRKGQDMESINGRMLNRAIRGVFDIRKERMRSQKQRVSGLKYMSLIPDSLRKKNVTYPKISLRRGVDGKPWTVMGMERIRMELLKADRNRKEVTFGVLATLLHCDPGSVLPVVNGISTDGLNPSGCKLWSYCSDHSNCDDIPKQCCEFTLGQRNDSVVVGKGTVDPFTTFLEGEEISSDSLVVRFSEILQEDRVIHDYPNERVLQRPVVWLKKNIRRIRLLGPAMENWGDAIIVVDDVKLVKKWIRSDYDGLIERNHPKHTIVLCELSINPFYRNETYPFAFWYSDNPRKLRRAHFCDDRIPLKLEDIPGKTRALLWHRDRIAP